MVKLPSETKFKASDNYNYFLWSRWCLWRHDTDFAKEINQRKRLSVNWIWELASESFYDHIWLFNNGLEKMLWIVLLLQIKWLHIWVTVMFCKTRGWSRQQRAQKFVKNKLLFSSLVCLPSYVLSSRISLIEYIRLIPMQQRQIHASTLFFFMRWFGCALTTRKPSSNLSSIAESSCNQRII